MYLARHAHRQSLFLKASKDHFWISDDVLNNAMQRFAHGRIPRRHVGLAPGPLEARKRAARRRMMNLAQIEGGVAFDPSVLPGSPSPGCVQWTWQSPKPFIPQTQDETPTLPTWLTDIPPTEVDHGERSEEEEHVWEIKNDKDSEQQGAKLKHKHPLANLTAWKDFEECKDVEGLYRWAATYELDVQKFSRLLFVRMCHLRLPLSVLLHALEDTALGTVGNLNFLLDWQLWKKQKGGGLHNRIKPDDIALLQQWMKRQVQLGLKSEGEILVYLRFISRISDADVDESITLSLMASLEGLQSNPVFGFKNLVAETQLSILECITQGPVTRQRLKMGFNFVEDMPLLGLKSKSQKIAAFIGGVIHAHVLGRESDEQVCQLPEMMPIILETIWDLPLITAGSVIFTITKALVNEHLSMLPTDAANIRLPDSWLSAIAMDTRVLRKRYLRYKIESFLGMQEQEVAVPYLQQLNQRDRVSFIIRHWFGPRPRYSRSQDWQTSGESRPASEIESPWMNVYQTIRQGTDVKKTLKKLQVLHQSEAIIQIVKQSRRRGTIVKQSDVVYTIREHLEDQPHLAELLFQLCPTLRLEWCPELAERMILNPETHPNNALRFLRKRSRFPGPRHIPQHKRFLEARVELIGKMALAYSRALHIRPRVACRYAQKCYAQHMKEHLGPVSAAIARAFTQAGLIRPLQAGQRIDPYQVGWILSFVQSVEGSEVEGRVHKAVYEWRGINLKNIAAALASKSI